MASEPTKAGWRVGVSYEMRIALLLAGAALAILVLLAQGMISVVMGLLGCGLLLLLGRTVGDWLTDVVGPVGRGLVVAVVLVAVGWQVFSSPSRRATAVEFLGLDAYWSIDSVPEAGLHIPPSSGSQPASVVGSTSGITRSTGGSTKGGASSAQSKSSDASRSTTSPVRMAVVSHSDATGVRLDARLNGADKIDGIVDFFVNGRRVASVSVSPDGSAVANVPNLEPGTYRVEARFRGRGDLGEASSRTTLERH